MEATFPPRSVHSLATAVSFSVDLPWITMFHPFVAKARAIAAPIPRLAPVITIVLKTNRKISVMARVGKFLKVVEQWGEDGVSSQPIRCQYISRQPFTSEHTPQDPSSPSSFAHLMLYALFSP